MTDYKKQIEIYNTKNSCFFKLEDILIIPFGWNYIGQGKSPVVLETCYPDGAMLRFDNPCAVINKAAKSPLRLKDLPKLFPKDILPITDSSFRREDGQIIAKRYYDYLTDFYKKEIFDDETTPQERDFLDIYFQFCFDQIKFLKQQYYERSNQNSLARKIHEKSGDGYDFEQFSFIHFDTARRFPIYPLNDGRVIFEALLPLYEPHLSVPSSDPRTIIYNSSNSTSAKTIFHEYTDERKLIPIWKKENHPRQINKELICHTRIDFCFWDGNQIIGYEIDSDVKLLSDYNIKHSSLRDSGIKLTSISNATIKGLKSYLSERSPDPMSTRNMLNKLGFTKEITNFWETLPETDPMRMLLPDGFFRDASHTVLSHSAIAEFKNICKKSIGDFMSNSYGSVTYHFNTISDFGQELCSEDTQAHSDLYKMGLNTWFQDRNMDSFAEYVELEETEN